MPGKSSSVKRIRCVSAERWISALISFMRSLVFELLSVLILPLVFGIDGIWSAISVAEIMAFIMSMSFMLKYKSKYNY